MTSTRKLLHTRCDGPAACAGSNVELAAEPTWPDRVSVSCPEPSCPRVFNAVRVLRGRGVVRVPYHRLQETS